MKKAIILDLDGTISLLNGRNPYKFHLSGSDLLNDIVYDIVTEDYNKGYDIIILTGRGLSSKRITQEWLKSNNINYVKLDMKPDSDNRPSHLYKEDKVKEYLDEYNIKYALDDNINVISMMLSHNIPCIHISETTGEVIKRYNISQTPLFDFNK